MLITFFPLRLSFVPKFFWYSFSLTSTHNFTQWLSLTDFHCVTENSWSYHACNKYICKQKTGLNYSIGSACSLLLQPSPNVPELYKWFFYWSKFPFYMLNLKCSADDYWSLRTIKVTMNGFTSGNQVRFWRKSGQQCAHGCTKASFHHTGAGNVLSLEVLLLKEIWRRRYR